jgi:hypothetical protein
MPSPNSRPALDRPAYVDVPEETWARQVLAAARLGPYVDEHLLTVARYIARTAMTA